MFEVYHEVVEGLDDSQVTKLGTFYSGDDALDCARLNAATLAAKLGDDGYTSWSDCGFWVFDLKDGSNYVIVTSSLEEPR